MPLAKQITSLDSASPNGESLITNSLWMQTLSVNQVYTGSPEGNTFDKGSAYKTEDDQFLLAVEEESVDKIKEDGI